MRFLEYCLAVVCLLCLIPSCKKDDSSGWDTEMLVPLVSTSLSVRDLVTDTSLIREEIDQSLVLTYQNTIYELNLADSIISVPDTFIGTKYTLDSLRLPATSINYRLSLGEIALNLNTSPDPVYQFFGNFLLTQNGTSTFVPAVNGVSQSLYSFDASTFFQEATLQSGTLYFWIVNQLPIPITNVSYQVTNGPLNTPVLSDVIPLIQPGDSVYKSYSLAGLHVSNTFNFNLVNLSSPGSNGVAIPIDTTDYVQLRGGLVDLRASEAWARFPAQDIVAKSQELTIDIADRKFTYLDVRKGKLHVYITSNVEESLQLTYILDGAYDNYGRPLRTVIPIPAAPPGNTVTIDQEYDLTGFSISLTGKDGSKFNTYTQTVIAHIDSSGILRHIVNTDSVAFKFELKDIAPNYIKGYAGRDSVQTGIDSSAFTAIDLFESGNIQLSDVDMKLSVENGFGIDGRVKINSLQAIGKNGQAVGLTGSILQTPFQIQRATDFPFQPKTSEISINGSNSNIAQLISVLPEKLIYDMEVRTNPLGNNGQYRDFAYLESRMKVNLDVKIPLKFFADHLILRDTVDFNLSNLTTNVEGISDGIIHLIAQNGYPLEAKLNMIFYDENGATVDTILFEDNIAGAQVGPDCKVKQSTRSRIPFSVSTARMEELKKAKRAIIVADFNTPASANCNGQPLQIYSTYKLDLTFSARFNYKLDAKF